MPETAARHDEMRSRANFPATTDQFAMTAQIINLRRARKAKSRRDAETQASRNRATHGLSKAERQSRVLESKRNERLLDGARRDTAETTAGGLEEDS